MNENNKIFADDQKRIRGITIWGMVTNILLAIIKTIVGVIVHSVALLADGLHSLSDLLTDVTVLVSNRAARRPPDLNHHYGHGKFEAVGAQLIGLALLLVGVGIGWSALTSLYQHHQNFPGPLVVIIASISVITKEVLFKLTRKIALQTHSSSLYANAWHHRSDAFSSFAVIVGGVTSLFGFGYGDQIAGLIVGMMVMAVAGKILIEEFKELSEHAIDEETMNIIEQILENHQGVFLWHKLRTRKIGSEIFVDVHIHVVPTLTVQESHQMTQEIEQTIKNKISYPVNTLIHVEPHFE
ncbi:MAG: cation diffusion facilitator family transporter [bacterium]